MPSRSARMPSRTAVRLFFLAVSSRHRFLISSRLVYMCRRVLVIDLAAIARSSVAVSSSPPRSVPIASGASVSALPLPLYEIFGSHSI